MPKKRLMDAVKDNIRVVGGSEKDAEDRSRRIGVICCEDP